MEREVSRAADRLPRLALGWHWLLTCFTPSRLLIAVRRLHLLHHAAEGAHAFGFPFGPPSLGFYLAITSLRLSR